MAFALFKDCNAELDPLGRSLRASRDRASGKCSQPESGRLPLVASALERAGKRSPAVLRLWAMAKAIPGEARLALNRFPTRCIRYYYLDGVLDYEINKILVIIRIRKPQVLRVKPYGYCK